MLVLGYTPPEEAATLAKHRISQCVYSLEYAQELSHYAVEAGATVHIHVKIDTGMSAWLLLPGHQPGRGHCAGGESRLHFAGGCIPRHLHHFAVSDEGQAGGRLYHAAVRLL